MENEIALENVWSENDWTNHFADDIVFWYEWISQYSFRVVHVEVNMAAISHLTKSELSLCSSEVIEHQEASRLLNG